MSGIARPKGSASPSVYWRRRLILLAVVLLVAAGLVKLIGGGGDEDKPAAGPQDTQQTSDTDDDDGDQQPRKRKKHRRDDSAAQAGERNVSVVLDHGGVCDPEAVRVTPSLHPDSRAGREVLVRLAFTTAAAKPCVLSFDDHAPLISISDGAEVVWESTRCDDLLAADSVRLEPGWLTYVDARWSGRASGRTCGENADYAEAGDYEAQVAVLGGEPASAKVTLESEPKPDDDEPDKSDKDDKNDKDGKSDKGDKKPDDEKSDKTNNQRDGNDDAA
ncbi:hypothetical protein MU582_19960 [Nocardioidaceae bacterium SCSIO 66511]|nr:hypothetical protein MU582_19960 [Nocardioidaceae bacterium SCSIO 66511]